ncbi:MAG: hypothetical protein R6V83_08915 [Candidatus Thorarchaeota archaeon]
MAELHVKWVEKPKFEYRGAIQVDFRDVRKYHLRVAIITVFVLAIYTLILSWIQSILQNSLELIILVTCNLLFGLIGARAYHLAGETGSESLHFVDPRPRSTGAQLKMEKSTLNDIHTIFEEANHHVASLASVQRDDYRDVAWFVVITYSVSSLIIDSVFGAGYWVIAMTPFVFGLVFAMVYAKSYLTHPRIKLIEGLVALEYYVSATIEHLEDMELSLNGSPILTWIQQNNDWLIYDFGYVFEQQPCDSLLGMYHFGVSTDSDEAFELQCEDASGLANYDLSSRMRHEGWRLEISDSDECDLVYLHREVSDFSIKHSWRITVDPERIHNDRLLLKHTLGELLSRYKSA